MSAHVNGLILAGGASRRMGTDKSLLCFHGVPQREFLFNLLKPLTREVHLSCADITGVPGHLNAIADRFDLKGPMNGILSAFSAAKDRAWLTVPVDMPGIDEKILRLLLAQRDPNAVATCFYDSEGTQPEPLLAVWEPHAFPLLMEDFMKGLTSPREFLRHAPAKMIQSPTPLLHVNINTPEDLDRFGNPPRHSS